MEKELETLKEYFNNKIPLSRNQGLKLLNVLEEELKIIEIIKSHKLLNYVLKNNKCASMYHLSDEEIKSLKEKFLCQ